MEKPLKPTKVLFMVQYPENVSPGQRFRFELYKDVMKENGFEITTASFINEYGYSIIFKNGFYFRKLLAVVYGFWNRFKLLFSVKQYSYILLQISAAPVGPPIFEWIITKALRKKIIYDFDGALWLEKFSEKNKLPHFLKYPGKTALICKWAYKVSCGNEYLVNYAKQYNTKVIYNPTCVDTINHHNAITNNDTDDITIGWTGSFSTLRYLYSLTPVLKKLQLRFNFKIKVICNQPPMIDLNNVEYVEWSIIKEVTELAKCQIGLMPLPDDEWSKGKCGFKLIQYLALEIPAVSSAVGVNNKIIENNINGFLCNSPDEWYTAIERLIVDRELRKRMGSEGKKKVISDYSLISNRLNFLAMFSD